MDSVESKLIRLSKSSVGESEKIAVTKVLDAEFLGMGANVQSFEHELSDFFSRTALCVANGTAALQLALQASNIGLGDEVLVPSLTYVATFQAVSAVGAKPIACDINPQNLYISIEDARSKITSKTRAIMPVHYGGDGGDIEDIYSLAKEFSLRVIEDAAHAFGSSHKGRKIGSFGDIACFSFDGIKNITSGEGGCVVTSDLEVVNRIKDIRLLGVQHDTESRYSGARSWEFDVVEQGWRYHMSNIMAAIGVEQLKRFPEMALVRQNICRLYDEYFKNSDLVEIFKRDYSSIVPHIYVVKIPPSIDRASVQKKLLALGIQTGFHYYPNHLLTFYRNSVGTPLRETEKIFPRMLTLPLHVDLKLLDVKHICDSLIYILEQDVVKKA